MESEIDIIWRHLNSNEQRVFFAIARYTGQRFSSIRSLRMSDVYDVDGKPLSQIRFTYEVNISFVDLPEILYKILRSYPLQRHIPENEFLFPSNMKDGKPITNACVQKWFKNACKKANENGLNLSAKHLRKAFLKELYLSGMSLENIKILLNMKHNSSALKYLSQKKPKLIETLTDAIASK